MKYSFKTYPELWFLTVTAFLTRFLWIGYPRQVVFDEVHFGKFISAYFKGEIFFDIHPPLGKLMYVFAGWLVGFEPGFAFDHIGEAYAGVPIAALRTLPALCGALLVPLVYLIARELGLRRPAATLIAAFVLFDNALLVQSRFMLLDIPLLFFGFSSIYLFLLGTKAFARSTTNAHLFSRTARGAATNARVRRGGGSGFSERLTSELVAFVRTEAVSEKDERSWFTLSPWLFLLISAVFLGLAISIKWTALAFSAPLFILFIKTVLKERPSLRFDAGIFALFIFIPLVLYLGFFAIHFQLTEPAKLGSFFRNVAGLNHQMFDSNLQDLIHPYSSRWFEWPIMKRTVYYWNSAPGGITVAVIYLLGNPFIWMVSLLNIVLGLLIFIKDIARRRTQALFGPALLLITFFANLLPFIPITRAMFLYHYFPALIFSFLIAGMNIDRLIPEIRIRSIMVATLIITSAVFFVYFAPLSYGTRINDAGLNERMWLPTWR
jgi:dolichyl-phosphate-mannose-protein mannosyltransferase